jgi:hypothetical protein
MRRLQISRYIELQGRPYKELGLRRAGWFALVRGEQSLGLYILSMRPSEEWVTAQKDPCRSTLDSLPRALHDLTTGGAYYE